MLQVLLAKKVKVVVLLLDLFSPPPDPDAPPPPVFPHPAEPCSLARPGGRREAVLSAAHPGSAAGNSRHLPHTGPLSEGPLALGRLVAHPDALHHGEGGAPAEDGQVVLVAGLGGELQAVDFPGHLWLQVAVQVAGVLIILGAGASDEQQEEEEAPATRSRTHVIGGGGGGGGAFTFLSELFLIFRGKQMKRER